MSQKSDYAVAAGVLGSTIVAYLAYKYPDRVIFDEERPGTVRVKGHPIIGTSFKELFEADRMYDAQVEAFERLDTMTTTQSSILVPARITTIDPRNIEHILKNNFPNYVKGNFMQKNMRKLLGHGIFVANGESWRLQRKIMSRIFSVANLRDQFSGIFLRYLAEISEHVFDRSSGQVVDFQDIIFKYTLDTFIELGFGTQLGISVHTGVVPFAQSFDTCQRNCESRFRNPFVPLIDALGPLLHPFTKSMKQHYDTVDDFAFEILEKRRHEIKEGKRFKDALSYFMEACDDSGNLLSDKALRDAILNLILAGRDTSASALTWTLYSILTNPHVEEKLMQEINTHIPNDDLTPAEYYEVLKGMTYAHAILCEVVRLYPGAPFISRTALEEDVLPDGTHVRKGDTVSWCSYAEGRSTKVWGSDAKEFKPERWITDNGQLIHEPHGKWPGFNAGPRICLGKNFAILQVLITITTLLRRYKFSFVPDQEIHYMVSLVMPMKNGLKVLVERRY